MASNSIPLSDEELLDSVFGKSDGHVAPSGKSDEELLDSVFGSEGQQSVASAAGSGIKTAGNYLGATAASGFRGIAGGRSIAPREVDATVESRGHDALVESAYTQRIREGGFGTDNKLSEKGRAAVLAENARFKNELRSKLLSDIAGEESGDFLPNLRRSLTNVVDDYFQSAATHAKEATKQPWTTAPGLAGRITASGGISAPAFAASILTKGRASPVLMDALIAAPSFAIAKEQARQKGLSEREQNDFAFRQAAAEVVGEHATLGGLSTILRNLGKTGAKKLLAEVAALFGKDVGGEVLTLAAQSLDEQMTFHPEKSAKDWFDGFIRDLPETVATTIGQTALFAGSGIAIGKLTPDDDDKDKPPAGTPTPPAPEQPTPTPSKPPVSETPPQGEPVPADIADDDSYPRIPPPPPPPAEPPPPPPATPTPPPATETPTAPTPTQHPAAPPQTPATPVAPATPPPDTNGDIQNRDRDRVPYVAQVQRIAGNLDYGQTGFSRAPETGAPIVWVNDPGVKIVKGRRDFVVIAGKRIPITYAVVEASDLQTSHGVDGTPVKDYGSGRVPVAAGHGRGGGIVEAYNRGKASLYSQEASDDALHEIHKSEFGQFQGPVVVRVADKDAIDAVRNFGEQSQGQAMETSPAERAKADVGRVDWSTFKPDSSIDSEDNRDFVGRFVAALPEREHGSALTASGEMTTSLATRIRNAMFLRAWGDISLLTMYSEEMDPEIKSILKALQDAAPFASAANVRSDIDMRPEVAKAVRFILSAKRNGLSYVDMLSQTDMFGRDEVTDLFVAAIAPLARRAATAKMASLFRNIVRVSAIESANADSLFATEPRSTKEIAQEGIANAEQEAGQSRPAATKDQAGTGKGGNQDDGPAFTLKGETPEELAARERAAKEGLERERAEEKARAQREKADRELADNDGNLVLRPTDVPTSKPFNPDQPDMFGFGRRKGADDESKQEPETPVRKETTAQAEGVETEGDAGIRYFDIGTHSPDATEGIPDSGIVNAPSPHLAGTPESVRVNAISTLKRLEKKRDAGEITEDEYRSGVQEVIRRAEERNEARSERRMRSGRRRGADWIIAKLMTGVANDTVPREVADFAEWLLDQNPQLADGLGVSITEKDGEGSAGNYNPLARVIKLFSGSLNTETAVHEIMHHTERMMPEDVQTGILSEWQRAWDSAHKKAAPKQKRAMEAMLAASFGDKTAMDSTQDAFRSGVLTYDQHYQLFSPSEFWAVNASRILSGRFEASGAWMKRAAAWFKEFVQRMKGLLGLPSDAPILKAMDAVMRGDGTFQSKRMLHESSKHAPIWNQITIVPPRQPKNVSRLKDLLRGIRSPSRIAADIAAFAPFRRMADIAVNTNEVIEKMFHRRLLAIHKALGRDGNRKQNLGRLTQVMFAEDIMGRLYTPADLKAAGITGGTLAAYHLLRSAYRHALALSNRVRAMTGLPPINERTGYVPHVFNTWRVRDANGAIISTYRTLAEAIKAAEQMPNSGTLTIDTAADRQVAVGTSGVELADREYYTAVRNLAGKLNMSVADARDMLDGVARASNKHRFMGNFIQRQGVSGYSQDLMAVTKGYLDGVARYAAMEPFKVRARRRFEQQFGEFRNEHTGIADYTKEFIGKVNGDIGKIEQWLDGLIKSHPAMSRYLGDRPSSEIASAITTTTSIAKLGFFAPLSIITNALALNNIQSMIGLRATANGMARAAVVMAELLRRRYSSGKTRHRSSDIGIIERSGVLLQQSLDGMDLHTGRKTTGSLIVRGLKATLAGFHAMELFLRMTAVLGQYHESKAAGKGRHQAIADATEVNRKVNFDYGAADAPSAIGAMGPVGPVLLQFKKYPIKQFEFLANDLKGAQHARWWIPFIAVAGIFGFPGEEALRKLARLATGRDVEAVTKAWIDRQAEEHDLPEWFVDWMKYGAPAPIAWVDFSGRSGLQDMIPTDLTSALGPTFGSLIRAGQMGAKGEWMEMGKAIAPFPGAVIQQLATGYDLQSAWDGKLVTHITPREKAILMTGGRPVRISRINDAKDIAADVAAADKAGRAAVIRAYLDAEEAGASEKELDAIRDEADRDGIRVTGRMIHEARMARNTPRAERALERVPRYKREMLGPSLRGTEEEARP